MKKSKHEFMICTTRKSSTVPVLVVILYAGLYFFYWLPRQQDGWIEKDIS